MYRKIKEKQIWKLYLHDHILCLWKRRKRLAILTYLKLSHLKMKYKCGSFLSFAFSCHYAGRDTRRGCSSTCRLLPSEEEQQRLLALFSCLVQTKANRQVPLKERTSKLQAGSKASADLAFIQIHVCSFPVRARWWGRRNLPKCYLSVTLSSNTGWSPRERAKAQKP